MLSALTRGWWFFLDENREYFLRLLVKSWRVVGCCGCACPVARSYPAAYLPDDDVTNHQQHGLNLALQLRFHRGFLHRHYRGTQTLEQHCTGK